MRVGIVGSRDFPNKLDVINYVNSLPDDTIIISGGARGVDRTAEDTARARGLRVEVFPAEWNRFGRRAGYLRNIKIVDASDRIVAFWDGVSKGTVLTINIAKEKDKPCLIKTPS